MPVAVLPYLLLIMLIGGAAVLLTSKTLSEKFVAAGILPRAFLGVLPALQAFIRVFGGVLVVAGAVKIAIDSGWIDAAFVSRYAFSGCLVILGVILLLFSGRKV